MNVAWGRAHGWHPPPATASTEGEGEAGWAIPAAVVMCESGGRNLPPNEASASGYYQIIRSTWEAYGGAAYASEAWLASASEQGIVARRVWADGNGSQWVCKA